MPAKEDVMGEIDRPNMRNYGRQLFICSHGDCAPAEEAERLNRLVLERNRQQQLNKLRNPHRIKCTLADCLGVCQGGPILVVYPDGIWYHGVDEEAMERIYREHLIGGRPVEAFIFHRQFPAGQEPAYAPDMRGDDPLTPIPWTPLEREAESEVEGEVDGRGEETAAEVRRMAARRGRKKKGLVIVNTGEGKGKTTAALGVMTRAWGRRMKIGVIQFLKNENARFGEIRAAERMGDIEWISSGDGWTWTSSDMDETVARARHAWSVCQERIVSGEYDLLILDEFTYLLHYGWVDGNEALAWLEANKPRMLHLVITGRYAPRNLIDFADLVTEMRDVKHPFAEQGIRAQAGIEY